MALEGELKGLNGTKCSCGERLALGVQQSPAGYYLGYCCNRCGPWSRETGYYRTRQFAEMSLGKARAGLVPSKLRDAEYRGGGI